MYLKRKADAYLNAWKSDPNRSPLIIKGPRQVGKTETIDYFAAHNYRSVVEINFVEEPKYRAITCGRLWRGYHRPQYFPDRPS